MITSLFRKSTPLNYSVVIIGVVIFFFLYQIGHATPGATLLTLAEKFGLLVIIFASLFTTNFIVKKNNLSRDSSYTVLFFLIFILFFPSIMDRPNLLLSNFFLLLSFRRLVSLLSPKSIKEKIFDASLWVFVASLFHFWNILFIVLVFISILFHAARDYRNWLLPFVAAILVIILFLLYSVAIDGTVIDTQRHAMATNFSLNYFTDNMQNLALSIYASISVFFLASMLMTLSGRPLLLQASYKKIIVAYILGIVVFLVSPNKSNDLLLFTFAPLAFMATSHIELPQNQIKQEVVLALLILCGLFLYFSQL